MTTTAPSSLTPMSPVGLGGHLTFTPRVTLPEHQSDNLRAAFMARTGAEGAENGRIVFDWWCNNADGPPYHQREVVMLYCDGGDWEDPRALLYRTGGHTGGFPASAHVPPQETTERIAAIAYRLWDNLSDLPENMAFLNDYLASVINDATAWQPCNLDADPDAEPTDEPTGEPAPDPTA